MPTPYLFLDTSALLKRYHMEAGSEVVFEIMSRPELRGGLFVAAHIGAELNSALNKRYRNGEIGRREIQEIKMEWWKHQGLFAIVPLLDTVLWDGQRILSMLPDCDIQAGDACHLGAIQYLLRTALRNQEIVLVSADRPMLHAAKRIGISTFNPERDRLNFILY